jgi:hypothetical protein
MIRYLRKLFNAMAMLVKHHIPAPFSSDSWTRRDVCGRLNSKQRVSTVG